MKCDMKDDGCCMLDQWKFKGTVRSERNCCLKILIHLLTSTTSNPRDLSLSVDFQLNVK